MKKWIGSFAAVLFLAACNGDGLVPGMGDDDDDGATPTPGVHFENGGFPVPEGQEFYHCWFRTVPTGETPGNPVGATRFAYTPGSAVLHHIVIFSDPDHTPDGDRQCDVLEGQWNPRYAGGTSTDPLTTPEGVAFPVEATETWVFQMHYANATGADVVDYTTADITLTEPNAEFVNASLVVSGQTGFTIPAETLSYDVIGDCNVPAGIPTTNIFAIWPHMHQYGTHFKIDMTLGGSLQTVWDQPWDFGDQPLYRLTDELVMNAGDNVHTTCTYTNPGLDPVPFGESSTQEMCFDFFFYYPAIVVQTLPCIE